MCTANNATHQIGVYSSVPQEYNTLKIVSVRDIVNALYCWGWAGGLLCAPPLPTSTKCLVLVVLLGDFLRKAIGARKNVLLEARCRWHEGLAERGQVVLRLEISVEDGARGLARDNEVDAVADGIVALLGDVESVVHRELLGEREGRDLRPDVGASDGLVVQFLGVVLAQVCRFPPVRDAGLRQ